MSELPYKIYFVPLDQITFPKKRRPRNDDLVNQLFAAYEVQGCLRDQWPLIAVIPDDKLPKFIAPREGFLKKARCLHGFHRIEAAKAFLEGDERYWPVQVYNFLSRKEQSDIMIGNWVTGAYTDGLILHNSILGDESWRATLSKRKNQAMDTILNNYRSELEALKSFDGLWYDVDNLGTMAQRPTMFKGAWKKYLDNVYKFWSKFPSDAVDRTTVNCLHLLCPRVPNDRDTILKYRKDDKLFLGVSMAARAEAYKILLNSEVAMIPTLKSFFMNIEYEYHNRFDDIADQV